MNSCRYCKYAAWPKKANGARNPNTYGECTYPIKMSLPSCASYFVAPSKLAIWYSDPHEKCATFQPELG